MLVTNELRNIKLRNAASSIIRFLPFNALRIFCYRIICGYHIAFSAKIGFGTLISVDSAVIGGADIGKYNIFRGPFILEIENGAKIGNHNTVECNEWVLEDRFRSSGYQRSIRIEKNTLITSGHYFDATGSFVLKENSWIAGLGSQFWTHGAGVTDRNITIGSNCYIGSSVIFTPGSAIGDNCLIGSGSIITKKFEQDNVFIGGDAAKIIKENYNWNEDARSSTSL